MSQKKLSNSEKQQLKNRLKKFGLISFVVISSILNILFVVSLCVGCANTKKADAFNYQGVVTTPVVQTCGLSTYEVKATSMNLSLPSNYSIFLNYPNYDVGESFLPYTNQFFAYIAPPTFTNYSNETFYIPLKNYRDGTYRLGVFVHFNPSVDTSYPTRIRVGLYKGNEYTDFLQNNISNGYYRTQLEIIDYSLFNELVYYNSYISYSLSDTSYVANIDENSYNYTYSRYDDNLKNRFNYLLRAFWYFFSRDSWVDNLHLTSDSIIGANNYLLQDLKYEGLVGKEKYLNMASVINGNSTTTLYYFNLQGSFYFKGEVYNSLVFYYEKVYKGSSSEFELYVGDIQDSNVVNQKLLYECDNPSYNNLFYLSSVYLAKVPNLSDIFSLFDTEYQTLLYHVYESNFVWQGINQHQIFLNLFASQQSISSNNPYPIGSVGSEYDLPFGYIFSEPGYNIWNFYQNITNAWVIPVIIDNDASVEDMFAQTYYWMIFAINSFASILSFSILPGITLGAILLTPLVVTIIIFIAKLFKR